jgi:hypothetical protein
VERSDERLSTRDIASGSSPDETEPEADRGAVAASDAPPARGPSPEAIADAGTDERGAPEPAAPAAAPAETGHDGDGATAVADEEDRRDVPTETAGADDDAAPLLDGADEFQARWEEIQVRFVDEPRGAVEDADALVATVMQRLADGFASERERLEAQWGRGEDISTEDLRVSLQRYRSFFRRLLST